MPLNDPASLDDMKWISQGILGQILESIRNEQLICQSGATGYYPQLAFISKTSTSTPTPPEADTAQSTPMVVASAPQPIPSATINCQPVSMEGSPSGTDSVSTSASTTPVSDTSARDTDSGETVSGPTQDSNQNSS